MLWLKTRFPSNIDFISNNKLISTFGAWNTRDKRQTHWLSVLRTSNTQYSVCFPDYATNRMLMFIMSVTYIHVVWQTHFLVGFDDKTHPRTNTLAHKMCVFSTSKTVYCTRMNVHTIIDERWFSGIGPILDDRLKEKILKPWKGAHSSHSVCPCVRVSVCPSVRVSVRGLQVTSFDLVT